MAEVPQVKTKRITRDKLAQFLPSHELIKSFENITDDVVTTLPQATYETAVTAEAAQATADSANIAATNAQLAADQARAIADQLAAAPGYEVLLAEIHKLRSRVAALEQGNVA